MTRAQRPRGAPIDWAAVRARIDHVAAIAEAAAHPSEEQARSLLEERARELARPLATKSIAAGVEVVTFRIMKERYALPISHVLEVARLRNIAPIPGVSRPFLGITSLRGELVALIDVTSLLGSRGAETGAAERSPSWALVLGTDRAEIGVVADEVLGIEPLEDPSRLSALTSMTANPAAEGPRPIFRGVLPSGPLLLDAEALLADERLIVDHTDNVAPELRRGEDRG